jgi:hypothetical protein
MIAPRLPKAQRDALVRAAQEMYGSDDVEVGLTGPRVSLNDEGGAWVSAMVYIPPEQANLVRARVI